LCFVVPEPAAADVERWAALPDNGTMYQLRFTN
jgi:hypothetical protein